MSADVVKAMVLAAGEGTRLRPLTLNTPKVLLPIGGVPLIEHTLLWLKNHGVDEAAVNLYHLGEKIKDFLGDGSGFGVKVVYSPEVTLLGTAGGVKKMEHFFGDTFVVVYGDVLTDFDLSDMLSFHQGNNCLATIAILEVASAGSVGVVEMNQEGRLLSFVEKPSHRSGMGNLGSGGVYVFEKEVLKHMPEAGYSDFGYDCCQSAKWDTFKTEHFGIIRRH